jgi:hypothetical protein
LVEGQVIRLYLHHDRLLLVVHIIKLKSGVFKLVIASVCIEESHVTYKESALSCAGANSWQGYTADGKLFSAAPGGALLNSSQFQGCFQNPSPNSGSQTLIRHPSQPMLQNLPSRPSTPVAILSSDGTVTVTLNGFTSQSIPLIAPAAQSTQMLAAGQGSNPASLSQLLQQHQPPQAQQFGQQQQQQQQLVQNIQDSQMAAQGLQMPQPQIFQNFQTPNLQTQSFPTQNPQEGMQLAPAQYVQLSQGPSYQVAGVQQPGVQGATPVGQGLPAGASLSNQQPAFGPHGGPAGQSQMVQVGGYREVRYAQDESRHVSQQVRVFLNACVRFVLDVCLSPLIDIWPFLTQIFVLLGFPLNVPHSQNSWQSHASSSWLAFLCTKVVIFLSRF